MVFLLSPSFLSTILGSSRVSLDNVYVLGFTDNARDFSGLGIPLLRLCMNLRRSWSYLSYSCLTDYVKTSRVADYIFHPDIASSHFMTLLSGKHNLFLSLPSTYVSPMLMLFIFWKPSSRGWSAGKNGIFLVILVNLKDFAILASLIISWRISSLSRLSYLYSSFLPLRCTMESLKSLYPSYTIFLTSFDSTSGSPVKNFYISSSLFKKVYKIK